ncbi:MAG: hypothetical protein SWH61_13030 [Thermodesulfobacteriota bacterium]|nr:hypothetical protein [Thermodesulfobacteriota bacterium]
MNDMLNLLDKNDYIGCIGNYNPQDRLCTKKCALALKCVIEYNRNIELTQLEEIFGEEDMGIAGIN